MPPLFLQLHSWGSMGLSRALNPRSSCFAVGIIAG